MISNKKKDPTADSGQLVSVIIPTYNSADYLPAAIESALAQTYSYKEIIVIDDGSTDNTRFAVQPFKDKIVYIQKENQGPASARNSGIMNSKGEFIAFLDADDIWLPGKIKAQVEFFRQNPDFSLVHTNTWIMENGDTCYPTFVSLKPPSGNAFNTLFLSNHISTLTVMLKRDCLEGLNGFDENKALIGLEDYDLWLRIALKHKIGYLDEILSVYRIHDANISDESKLIQSNLFLIEKLEKSFEHAEVDHQNLILSKKKNIYYRWACNLMERGVYDEAQKKFIFSINGKGLLIGSLIGLIGGILKTNLLMKNRKLSYRHACKAEYFMSLEKYKDAKYHYLRSILFYPIQKRSFKQLVKIFFVNIKHIIRLSWSQQ
jgi:glycosyltransferase involved in cell wall biosynthesis